MKRVLGIGALLVALAGAAWAAEKFEDKTLGLRVEAPEGYTKAENPKLPEEVGEVKAFYVDPNAGTNAGSLLIHHMDLPDGADYSAFKTSFGDQVGTFFGNGFKLVKQEDTDVPKLTGFMLEFECPGDDREAKPGGNIQHHIRWYFFRDGEKKLVGVVYHSLDLHWKALEPKFAASFKTLKKAE